MTSIDLYDQLVKVNCITFRASTKTTFPPSGTLEPPKISILTSSSSFLPSAAASFKP